jgi:anti-sigma regulatory factor (Ser/Thr protein kinase)
VSAARRALDGLDGDLGASAFYDASLCVSELVTNAVLHSGKGPDDELELVVSMDDGLLRVSVADAGPDFAPPEPTMGDESGWGLFIVDRLAHRWGVDRGEATCVWFEIGLYGRAEENGAAPATADATEPRDEPRRQARARRAAPIRLRPRTTA